MSKEQIDFKKYRKMGRKDLSKTIFDSQIYLKKLKRLIKRGQVNIKILREIRYENFGGLIPNHLKSKLKKSKIGKKK